MWISVRLERTSLCARSPWVVGKGTILFPKSFLSVFFPECCGVWASAPTPPFGRWTELWRQSWTVARWGEMLAATYWGKWAFGPDAERPRTGCSPPPSPFSKQVPFKFAPSLHVHVEVQHQELGFLCAVTAAHRTNKFGIGGTDAPDYAAAASALQCDEVADKLARPKVPQLHRTIIRAGDDKILVELQACYCTLVLVGTWKQNKRNRS